MAQQIGQCIKAKTDLIKKTQLFTYERTINYEINASQYIFIQTTTDKILLNQHANTFDGKNKPTLHEIQTQHETHQRKPTQNLHSVFVGCCCGASYPKTDSNRFYAN